MHRYYYQFLNAFSALLLVHAATDSLIPPSFPPGQSCYCPGDDVTFTCTLIGGSATQWLGTAFDCVENSITLLHSSYSSGNAVGSCGSFTGRGTNVDISVTPNCYTSEVSVRINSNLNGLIVICSKNAVIIGSHTLRVADTPTPPTNLMVIDIGVSTFTITWDEPVSNCGYAFSYEIISDCGVCSVTSNTLGVCSQWTVGQVCSLRVRAVFNQCGHQMANITSAVLNITECSQADIQAPFSLLTSDVCSKDGFAGGILIDNGVVCYTGTELGSDHTAQPKCNPDYQLSPKSSQVRHCLPNGTWSGTTAECVPSSMQDVAILDSGIVAGLVILWLIVAGTAIASIGVLIFGLYKRKTITKRNSDPNAYQLQESVYEDPNKNRLYARTDSQQSTDSEISEESMDEMTEGMYEETDVIYEEADHQEEICEETEVVYEQTDVVYEELDKVSLDPPTQENIAYIVVQNT